VTAEDFVKIRPKSDRESSNHRCRLPIAADRRLG
jgi:hypothetical protein